MQFETALLSVAIGAILSVLIQGRLFSLVDVPDLPPGVERVLRAIDLWLVVVFALVVAVVIAAILDAFAQGEPLDEYSRRSCVHMLALAAVYPFAVAITSRALPSIYRRPQEAYFMPEADPSAVILPVVCLGVAATLISVVTDPTDSLRSHWLMIAVCGTIVIGGMYAEPRKLVQRRRVTQARSWAREAGLAEAQITVVMPYVNATLAVRVFAGPVGATRVLWIDRSEAERLALHLNQARRTARRTHRVEIADEHWSVRRFPVRLKRSLPNVTPPDEWPLLHGLFFDAEGLRDPVVVA